MGGYAFVSYSHGDGASYVAALAEYLGAAGIALWFDRSIEHGERWTRVVQQQLEGSAAVIVVMTPEAQQSEWVDNEILHAQHCGIPILPLLLRGRRLFALGSLHYEDVTDGRMPGQQFLSRLRGLLGATRAAATVESFADRYRIGSLLANSSYYDIYYGQDLRTARSVAIKLLRRDLAGNNTYRQHFRRGAENAIRLEHPNIVAGLDTGETLLPTGESVPYLVMELVEGRDLRRILTEQTRLNRRHATTLAVQICTALDYAHGQGIIHLDIKPGKVICTETGTVKVADFGSLAVTSGDTGTLGTAAYISPERARGELYDARTDLYSLGCLLFEMLCGRPPFVGDSPVDLGYRHVLEKPAAPSSHLGTMDGPLDAIVLKALEKRPADRYQTAAEMRAALLRTIPSY